MNWKKIAIKYNEKDDIYLWRMGKNNRDGLRKRIEYN